MYIKKIWYVLLLPVFLVSGCSNPTLPLTGASHDSSPPSMDGSGDSYSPPVATIPIIDIATDPDAIIDHGDKTQSTLRVIEAGTSTVSLKVPVGIEIRGFSSSSNYFFHKKNYGIELRNAHGFDRDERLLGLPAESDWVLHGGGHDLSILNNVIVFDIYRNIMKRYAPGTAFFNLYFNGTYHGLYVLIEKIKPGPHRVAIEKLTPDDRFGRAVTGGYILAFDRIDSAEREATYIRTNRNSLFSVYYPKFTLNLAQQHYLAAYLNNVEDAIERSSSISDLEPWIDVASLVDLIIINILTANPDAFFFSTYFYKKRGDNKLYIGPPWDYDFGLSNTQTRGYYRLKLPLDTRKWLDESVLSDRGLFFWDAVFSKPFIWRQISLRWQELRHDLLSAEKINSLIDTYLNSGLRPEAQKDFRSWGSLPRRYYDLPKGPDFNSYQEVIDHKKRWISDRITQMDLCFNQWPSSCFEDNFFDTTSNTEK